MADEPKQRPPTSAGALIFNLIYVVGSVVLLLTVFQTPLSAHRAETVPYSQFLTLLDHNNIADVVLGDTHLEGTVKQPGPDRIERFTTTLVEDPTLATKLHEKGVTFRRELPSPFWTAALSWLLPAVFIYAMWMFASRRLGGGVQGGLLSLTKSRAKVYIETDVKTTFADVAGVDEAKDELTEVVSFLRDPAHYTRLGGHLPKGVLLVGPPGTGKTLLARAVAGEASVPFFSINGSEFVEMFVGLGAARVRDMFAQARKSAPCILFIDEVDALGKSRALSAASAGTNDEKEQTLNQLLAEMDGFDGREGVILLAATNRPEVLDQALLRAGRFDRQVLVGFPDQAGRAQILAVHVKTVKLAPDVELRNVAALTPGFSGADLANTVNEAALVATRRGAAAVGEVDFINAVERIVAGLEQKKRLQDPLERRKVACHEMGHATVALVLRKSDRVQKVSIIPRGLGALGYTLQRPTDDRHLLDEADLLANVAVLLGGRAAEKVTVGSISTGDADDLVKATEIARAMVARYGMSDRLGLAVYETERARFLTGTAAPDVGAFSDQTAQLIDLEIRRILDMAFATAVKIVKDERVFHAAAVERLLATETLDEQQIQELWQALHSLKPTTPAPAAVGRRPDGMLHS